MKWNQVSIHQWAIDQFGDASLNTNLVGLRMMKELLELNELLYTKDNPEEVSKEAADTAIVLLQFMRCAGLLVAGNGKLFDECALWAGELKDEWAVATAMAQAGISALISIQTANPKEAHLQMTRIAACLDLISDIYGFYIDDAVDAKMDINAARAWAKAADGSYQHA